VTLIEDEVDANRYTAKVRLKGSKKSTVRKHMNFGSLKNSIQEIATKLTTATIESHLVKLIQSKESVSRYLPDDKIQELSKNLNTTNKNLNAMKSN
jgi:hypothetical protein